MENEGLLSVFFLSTLVIYVSVLLKFPNKYSTLLVSLVLRFSLTHRETKKSNLFKCLNFKNNRQSYPAFHSLKIMVFLLLAMFLKLV